MGCTNSRNSVASHDDDKRPNPGLGNDGGNTVERAMLLHTPGIETWIPKIVTQGVSEEFLRFMATSTTTEYARLTPHRGGARGAQGVDAPREKGSASRPRPNLTCSVAVRWRHGGAQESSPLHAIQATGD